MSTIKNTARKILPKGAYSFIKNIVKPPKTIEYYSSQEVLNKIKHFSLKKIAILTDGSTDLSTFSRLIDLDIVGVYSFNLEAMGKKILNHNIRTLMLRIKVDADGWIISSLNETDGFSLNQRLLESDSEEQVIIQHVKLPNSTKYYSYIDFFSNEQKTIVQINNYFRRCYALPFPIDLKLTLRDINGKVCATRQVILAPDEIKVIKSEDFDVKNFVGYLEVEFEISKKVTPFLHYMTDYVSADFISSNHQSGLGLHPANSEFTRGYIPTEKDKSLEVCLFQHDYDTPIIIQAILNYTDHKGEIATITKNFPPLAKKQMLYQDIKRLFNEVDFVRVKSPFVTVKSEVPLHRPNYYYTAKNKKGYYDTSHAGPDLKNHIRTAYKGISTVTGEEKRLFEENDIATMDMRHHVLPPEMRIHSIISVGGNDATAPIKDFCLELYDFAGNFLQSFEETFDFEKERYLNLNEYAARKGFGNFSGTISFKPGRTANNIPIGMNSITGYIHRDSGYMSSTAGNGSNPDNIPFYFRGGPPNYFKLKCSAGTTDIFARGRCSEEFETLYTVSFQTADQKANKNIVYEIQLTNSHGERRVLQRNIAPNGCDVIKLSDLVKETALTDPNGFYTVWLFSSNAHLYAQHILWRKTNDTLAVEHFYAGKFGL